MPRLRASDALAVGVHGMVVSESADAAARRRRDSQAGRQRGRCRHRDRAGGRRHQSRVVRNRRRRLHAHLHREGTRTSTRSTIAKPRRMQLAPTCTMRDGKPDEDLARDGILGVGVPGEIAGIDAALRRFGTMKFQQIAAPADKLAARWLRRESAPGEEIAMLAPKLEKRSRAERGFPQARRLRAQAGRHDRRKESGRDAEEPRRRPGREVLSRLRSQTRSSRTCRRTADSSAPPTSPTIVPIGAIRFTIAMPTTMSTRCRRRRRAEWSSRCSACSTRAISPGLGVNSPPYLARLIEVMRQGFIDREQYADPAFVGSPDPKLLTRRLTSTKCASARCIRSSRRRRLPPRTITAPRICWSRTRTATSSR